MNTEAMVQAPMEEQSAAATPITRSTKHEDDDVCSKGNRSADMKILSGMDDRHRNGTNHGGVSMPDQCRAWGGVCRPTARHLPVDVLVDDVQVLENQLPPAYGRRNDAQLGGPGL